MPKTATVTAGDCAGEQGLPHLLDAARVEKVHPVRPPTMKPTAAAMMIL
jgi:hypothetical protein